MSGSFSRDRRGVTSRFAGLATDEPKRYSLCEFSGDYVKDAVNLIGSNGSLAALKPPELIGQATLPSYGRTVLARCAEGPVELIKIGASIYAKKESGEIILVSNNGVTVGDGIIFRSNGAFYITDIDGENHNMFKVTDAFAFSAVSPTIPLIFTGLAAAASDTDTMDLMIAEPNALTDFVDVGYSLGRTAVTTIYVPGCIRIDSVNKITLSNGREYTGSLTIQSGTRQLLELTSGISGNIVIRYKLKSTAYADKLTLENYSNVRKALFESYHVAEYYDSSETYQTVLGTCGMDKYFNIVAFSNPLYVTPDSAIRFKLEDYPTAVVKYYDGLLIFTAKKILFLKIYGNGHLSELSIDISTVKRDFGCDMPYTAVGFDDHVMFANSKNGVFYIGKHGYFDKDVTFLVSDPVYDELFSHTESELKAAKAICTKDAYYIAVGDEIYVWYYADKFPTSPTESSETRKRYNWSRLHTVNTDDFICFSGNDIYLIERSTGKMYIYHGNRFGEEGDETDTELKTRDLDLGENGEKTVSCVRLELWQCGDVDVRFCYDGEPSSAVYTVHPSDFDTVNSVDLRPDRHKFKTISVELSSSEPMRITQIDFFYRKTR